jgi:NADPH:quinone reductase-like Zn-dependent oxidoreductase
LGRRVATLPTKLTTAFGTLAEKIVAPVDALVPCPESFSDSECSAIWLHYLTAYAGLVDIAHVGMGDVVLVNSATTNLGIASIQLAKAQWATTIAIARDASRESELRSMGADFVLYADQDDIESQIQKITRGLGPQVVFSSFAEPLFSKAMALLKFGGTFLESQDLSEFSLDTPPSLDTRDDMTMRHCSASRITEQPEKLAEATKYICDGLALGFLQVEIARKFEFLQVVDAYQYLESSQGFGKVVVTFPEKALLNP